MFTKIRSFLSIAILIGLLSVMPGRIALADSGTYTRVSVDSNGGQANGGSSRSVISSDGRFVAFESGATNLVIGEANPTGGIFLHDNQTGQTTRVATDGETPSISSDGSFVAYVLETTVSNTEYASDVYLYNRQAGTTALVSAGLDGNPGNGHSENPSVSGDGRFVAFNSEATNLVDGDTDGMTDVFVRDTQANTTALVSVALNGGQPDGRSSFPAISADGRYVAFISSATNLVNGDTNSAPDIFVRDLQTGSTTLASVDSNGVQANKGSSDPFISANGRYVSFSTYSDNLVSEDTMGFEYVYVHDMQTGETKLASLWSDGNQMIGWSENSVLSADGRYVAFLYDDKGDGMPTRWIYVHDLATGQTVLGAPGDSPGLPSLSGDGHLLAFSTELSNLVSGDTNGVSDTFIHQIDFGPDLSPTVSSINPGCGDPCVAKGTTATFNVTFSEIVNGVDPSDFRLTTTGNISGASVTNVKISQYSLASYVVTVGIETGDGTIRLDLIDDDSIKDVSGNPLGGPGLTNGDFTSGGVITIDQTPPTVVSIQRADPDPTSASPIRFTITFSKDVNIPAETILSNFALTTTGNITNAAITTVNGSGHIYTAYVNPGYGTGTIRLDVIDNDQITDNTGRPLGGPGAGNGNFTSGEFYTVNRTGPTVLSSVASDPNPTSAGTVHFTVTFSEAVSGVDVGDFGLTLTGLSGVSIASVNGSGNIYTVAVSTGTGAGTIRLDVIDDDSIVDTSGIPLGGVGSGNGNFSSGNVYTINRKPPTIITDTFRSNGNNDGWVLESSQGSNQGGSKKSNAPTFNLGDDAQNRQYRSILHFPTYYLPDNATITMAILMIKKQSLVGNDPFGAHQNIAVDIRSGPFGFSLFGFSSLEVTDFQNPSSKDAVATIQNNPVGDWYWTTLDSSAFQYINLVGVTQFRLRFQVPNDNNFQDDYLKFYSGNADTGDRPVLIITYSVP